MTTKGPQGDVPLTGMDAASLQLFVLAAETHSLSRAAALLGISQPAASRRIHILERWLGCSLLHRTPNGSSVTADGERVLGSVHAALDALREVRNIARGIGDATRSLRVIASPVVADQLLPGWLSSLGVKGPRVSVDVRNSPEVLERLVAGRADLGFLCVPDIGPLLDDTGLSARPLASDRLCLAVHPKHPWARRKDPVTLEELAQAELVEREPQSETRAFLERMFAEHRRGGQPRPIVELSSTSALKGAVLDGAGPGLLSALSIVEESAEGRIAQIPVAGFEVERILYAVWPPASDDLKDVARLVATAEQVASAVCGAVQRTPTRSGPRARRTADAAKAE